MATSPSRRAPSRGHSPRTRRYGPPASVPSSGRIGGWPGRRSVSPASRIASWRALRRSRLRLRSATGSVVAKLAPRTSSAGAERPNRPPKVSVRLQRGFHRVPQWDPTLLMSLFRQRLLARLFDRHAISQELVGKLLAWRHPGFSAHAGAPIEPPTGSASRTPRPTSSAIPSPCGSSCTSTAGRPYSTARG
jgi:hypothetical protein